jgi:hypothetical protein
LVAKTELKISLLIYEERMMLVYETMGQKKISSLNRIVLQNEYHYL